MPIKERVESWIRDLEEEVAQLQGLIDALKSRLLDEDREEEPPQPQPQGQDQQPLNPIPFSEAEGYIIRQMLSDQRRKGWRVGDLAKSIMLSTGRPISEAMVKRALKESGRFREQKPGGWWSLQDSAEPKEENPIHLKTESLSAVPDDIRDAEVVDGIMDIMIRNPDKVWKPAYLVARLAVEADISVGSERVLTLLKRHQPDIFEMTKNGWWHISRNTSRKSA